MDPYTVTLSDLERRNDRRPALSRRYRSWASCLDVFYRYLLPDVELVVSFIVFGRVTAADSVTSPVLRLPERLSDFRRNVLVLTLYSNRNRISNPMVLMASSWLTLVHSCLDRKYISDAVCDVISHVCASPTSGAIFPSIIPSRDRVRISNPDGLS